VVFLRGTSLAPVARHADGMGKTSRGVDLQFVEDIDELGVTSWMQQSAALPGFGKR
jgi:hypothetical protein